MSSLFVLVYDVHAKILKVNKRIKEKKRYLHCDGVELDQSILIGLK
jgi:hypothetical protein